MNRHCLYFFFLFLLSVVPLFSANAKIPTASVPRQVDFNMTGVVEIADEDDAGIVRSVSLSCMNALGEYDYYPIENKGKGKELLTRIGETVRIKGMLLIDRENNRFLTVSDYVILNDEAGEQEPDEL